MITSIGEYWRRLTQSYGRACKVIIIFSFLMPHFSFSQSLTVVELNCENLFDYSDDVGKDDAEYLPEATRHWTKKRYWKKLNNIAQELLSTSDDGIPDLIALCEVENDSVLHDLTKRSLLRNARYEYLMTSSPDLRGIDVALLYSPFSFAPIRSYPLRVTPVDGMRPTPFRQVVADRLCQSLDSIRAITTDAQILIAGDFNDGSDSPMLQQICRQRIRNLTKDARGANGVKGTYRYQGEWERIDHILASPNIYNKVDTAFIHSPKFLLEDEKLYGGLRPRRTYNGMRYQPGYSDHLPLVVRLR